MRSKPIIFFYLLLSIVFFSIAAVAETDTQTEKPEEWTWDKGRVSTLDAFTLDFKDLEMNSTTASFYNRETKAEQTLKINEILRIEKYNGTQAGAFGLAGLAIGGLSGALAVAAADKNSYTSLSGGETAAFIAIPAVVCGLVGYLFGRGSDKYETVYENPILGK